MQRSTLSSRPFTACLALGIAALHLAGVAASAAEPQPPRLKRSEGFFGLHFDFHARDTDVDIGKNTTPEMVERILNEVHPDYLQIDCKGHKGYSSYPTKVGNPAPSIVGDPLRVWRDVTAKHGIPLVMHYSGVIDSKAVADHPDWCAYDATGKPTGRSTSLFGPYADKLMIPQLQELAVNYGVDAIWVDGDNWGVNLDYSPAALAAFTKATGFTEAPKTAKDPHWFEWLQFHREAFRTYLAHYVAEVKKVAPRCEVASNWAYSERMPEKVGVPVDFLSGDIVPGKAQQQTPVSVRYLAGQGKPWDIMSWSFTTAMNGEEKVLVPRPTEELLMEAAKTLAFGGGYQMYLKQERDGSVKQDLTQFADIAKWCRARQPFCFEGKQIPQVAVLLSTDGHYREIPRAFSPSMETFRGVLGTLAMAKYSTELLSEHSLTGRLKDYPLIVIPNWETIQPAFKKELLAHINDGGQVLLVGPKPAALFASELDIRIAEDSSPLPSNQHADPSKDPRVQIALGPKAERLDIEIKASNQVIFTDPGASVTKIGKGRLAVVYSSKPVGPLLTGVARILFPEPMVEVTKATIRDVVVNRIHGKLAVNLIGADGKAQGPADIVIRLPAAPTKLTLQPANIPLVFKYENGKATATLPKLALHDIVMVE